MNFNKIFDTQEILDDRIKKEKGLQGVCFLDEKILSLQVELGELANEWRGFKFWSEKNKPIVKADNPIEHGNPMLEEYVDCLHFILSIGNDLKLTPNLTISLIIMKQETITDAFLDLFELISGIDDEFFHKEEYSLLFVRFIELGELLGFSWEQIEQAYFDKNAENHRRQENGY